MQTEYLGKEMNFGKTNRRGKYLRAPGPLPAPRHHLMPPQTLGSHIKVCSMPLLESRDGSILRTNPLPDISMNPVATLIGPDGQTQCPISGLCLSNPLLRAHYGYGGTTRAVPRRPSRIFSLLP